MGRAQPHPFGGKFAVRAQKRQESCGKGGDAAGGGTLQSVDHDQQLHQAVINGSVGGLNHEYIGSADGLVEGGIALAIGEGTDFRVAQGDSNLVADGLSQSLVGTAGEDLDVLAV